jgi:hypothetical protein
MKVMGPRCFWTLCDRWIDAADGRGQPTESPLHESPISLIFATLVVLLGEHGLGDTGSAERRFPACDGGGAECSDSS